MEAFVVRQPIYDRHLNVVAYELLYSPPEDDNTTLDDTDNSQAMIEAFLQEGISNITGGLPAYVNLSHQYLSDGLMSMKSQDLLIPELLTSGSTDQVFLPIMQKLIQQGYKIALADLDDIRQHYPLIEMASVIKLDVQQLQETGVKSQLCSLRPTKAQLLADKIETNAEFELYKSLGFDLYQGFFLSKPKTLENKIISTSALAVLGLIEALNIDDIATKEVEEVISRDVRLVFKLLQIINSPLYALPNKIESLQRAIVLLGLDELKSWANVLAITALDNAPNCLLYNAMIRAKMCQELALQMGRSDYSTFFTVGLLSLLDAILDMPFNCIFKDISLSDEIVNAIKLKEGVMGDVLKTVIAYEKGDWENCQLNLSQKLISQVYLTSVSWADTLQISMN